jgi:hypothetical protein
MPVPVPYSPAYSGLVLALPGGWLLARAIAHRLTRDLGLRAVLPIGLTLALEVVAVQLASLLARSFRVGLPAGVILVGAAGVVAELARRRRPDAEPPSGRRPSPWMAITAALSAAALIPAAFKYWFHDELLIAGHMATVAQLANGIFPPRHLQFPEYPFRYHYGFDLIAAAFTALFRLQVDAAIDVGSLVLWAASWCLLWALGERLVGRRRAWLTPFMTLYASGLPLGCPHPGPSILPNMIEECPVGHWSVNGPPITYFFQHPWALGIPVAATAILVFSERAPRSGALRFALLAFLFGALSFSELVLFVTVLPALLVAELYYEDRLELRRAPALLGALLLAFGLAKLLGGFFVPAAGLQNLKFVPHAGFGDTLGATLRWNAMTFGVMWVTGLVGFLALRRGRLLFGLLAAGALVVVNSVRYGGSADIMKFATVVSLALGFLGSAAVARILPPQRSGASPVRSLTAALLLAGATWIGVAYPIIFALGLGDIPGSFRQKPDTLSPSDVEVTTFLRTRARAGEQIYRTGGTGYAQWAGLPQPWLNWTTKAWGFPQEKVSARDVLLRTKPAEVRAYRAQGFRWMVVDEALKDDKGLLDATTAWIGRGEARLATKIGTLRVVEINP